MQFSKKNLFIVGIFGLLGFITIFLTGFFLGQSTQFNQSNFLFRNENSDMDDLFSPYLQAWEIVHNQYLEQPVNNIDLMHGSIKGMMDSLGDPHSTYLNPEQFREQNAPLEGEYTGIGAWVDTSGKFLIIVSPMPNSPAEDVGLKPGDVVKKIDNQDVTHLDPSLVLRKILGPADTQILITVTRDGEPELLEFEITRAVIYFWLQFLRGFFTGCNSID